ncbi:MAG TPA: Gfo/Idh/MocA family oxidoreductase [Polyangia bacterium]
MIIVDNALKAREAQGKPIRVGMIGAGFMGQGLVNQIVHSVPGERMTAIFNRHVQKAINAYKYAGLDAVVANTQGALEDAIHAGKPVVTEDPFLLTRSEQIDCLVDVTGAVEFGVHVVLDAFKNKKHVVLMNAELDATIGPILQVYARKYGVKLSACDGDQPGVEINLWRYVKGLGLIPRVMGNIKGLQDRYRNPTTQKGFAEKWGQNPSMVTSFADGSKVSFEQAIVANGCGLKVKSRGMSRGYEHKEHVDTLTKYYDVDELRALGGIVDYVVGAQPNPGIYCIAEHTDPKQRHYLNLYKLGEGPLYSLYTPWHLCHFEVPNTVARVTLFGDADVPLGGPLVEVCACAKKDLKAGETLDEYGHYMTYGEAVNSPEMREKRYLPEGLVEGCKLKRDIAKDEVITYDDVELPPGRLADTLRTEQYEHFDVNGEART